MHHDTSLNILRLLRISAVSVALAYGAPAVAQSNTPAPSQGGVPPEAAAPQNPVPQGAQLSAPPAPVYPASPGGPGAAVTSAPSSAPVSATPGPAAVPIIPPAATILAPPATTLRAVDPERAKKIQALRERRAQVSLGVPIGLSAAGVALLAIAATSGAEALLYSNAGNCEGYDGAPDCLRRGYVWGFAGASIGAGVVGITLLAVGLPKLLHAFGERRAIRQEMRGVTALKHPSVAFDMGQHRAGLTLRARY